MEKELSKLGSKHSIPDESRQDMDRINPETLDWSQIIVPEHIQDQSVENRFREKLKAAGVDRIHREILICRFVYEYSFRQIKEELGIPSAMKAYRMMQDTLVFLRKKGFQGNEDDTLS